MVIRQFIAGLAAVAALVAALLTTAVPAAAEPTSPPAAATGSLPQGFPDDLRQYVDGTDEFRSAPWFSGACVDRGGDIGAYVNAVMLVEDRLMYWTANDEQKALMLGAGLPSSDASVARGIVTKRVEPPKEMLPRVFPAGDPSYRLPEPTCADDIRRWAGTRAWNSWGFEWSPRPDAQSMVEIAKELGDRSVPELAWVQPCSVHFSYCSHAYFVDCTNSDPATGDHTRCLAWNRTVGNLFAGTAEWIDANTSLSDRIQQFTDGALEAQYAGGRAVARGFAWAWDKGAGVVRFVTDPQSVIDDWANSSRDSAVELSARVLDGLASVGRFDPSADWFLRWYAYSTGIGIIVMGAMTLLALWRAAAKGETIKTISGDLFGYMPAGVVLMLFAPMFATLLVTVANDASDSIARTVGPDMGELITNLQLFTGKLTATDLAGGVLVGLILFLLLIAGALAVFFGLLMHQVALPMLAVASGIGFGMWVHPQWRKKALRPVLVFIAIVFSKPLLFLLLGTVTSLLNSAVSDGGDGKLGTLGQLCLVVVAFLVVGLAPWSLLRYAPLLPSRSDAAGFGQSSSLMAGAIGGVGTAMWWTSRGGPGRHGATGRSGGSDRPTPADGGGGSGPQGARDGGGGSAASPTGARFVGALGTESGTRPRRGAAGARRVTSGLGSVARGMGKAAMAATPIAAQAASGALNKARSTAESAPGDAESGSGE
ncbi:hypothetical protein IU433_22130 [Nocardia puris]|uniref:hypothetical protein n=1 Tax=Nocardia TaxID=1817 RepID=UPI000689C407|nr:MULTISPECIES: hypothetical protein [Nocardia]MBF6137218.1 hypothetical protein [Nocardia otitidiscaviarum]MBF6181822.1 hypothetical protein [Nocardia otitidiscaviarum]MBF6461715.1 hypothetical protein [Nocardia puris]MBF6488116.1 hypothetical protein [Nocardia otitidiscaviarum]